MQADLQNAIANSVTEILISLWWSIKTRPELSPKGLGRSLPDLVVGIQFQVSNRCPQESGEQLSCNTRKKTQQQTPLNQHSFIAASLCKNGFSEKAPLVCGAQP